MKRPSEKEKIQHSTFLVPYSYYRCEIPESFRSVPLHWHNEFEINYIANGTGCFRCDDTLFCVNGGDIIMIPPNMRHSVVQAENHTLYYHTLVFSKNLLSEPSRDRAYIELVQPIVDGKLKFSVHISGNGHQYLEMQKTAETIMFCAGKNCAKYDLLMKSELLRLVWLLFECGEIQDSISETAKYSEEIQNTVHFILKHFPDNITIGQLASFAHLSKSNFMRKFKQEVGQSAMAYLNCIRIKNACDILISTEQRTSDAAFQSGFRNLSNFNRQFLRYVGCSPSEYRKTVGIHLYKQGYHSCDQQGR